ncbi:MAG: hypothetical protein ACK5XA_08440 [Tagaea sp.]
MTTPYTMLKAAHAAPDLPALTHAVVRLIPGRASCFDRWELGGMTFDAVSAAALADSMAAHYPPRPIAHADGHRSTPGPWEVAELRDNPMGGEHAVPVHTGTAREQISPRELDMLTDAIADCRELLERIVEQDGADQESLDAARALVDRLDELVPDEAERTVTMDRAERRAFTPSEPESMPD